MTTERWKNDVRAVVRGMLAAGEFDARIRLVVTPTEPPPPPPLAFNAADVPFSAAVRF